MAGIAKNHDYHMVEPSPWPFVMSAAVLVMAMGAIFWMHDWTPWVFFVGLVAAPMVSMPTESSRSTPVCWRGPAE